MISFSNGLCLIEASNPFNIPPPQQFYDESIDNFQGKTNSNSLVITELLVFYHAYYYNSFSCLNL